MKKSLIYSFVFFVTIAARLLGEAISIPETSTLIDCSLEPISPTSIHGSLHNHGHGRGTFPHIPLEEGTSLNWSGYAALTNLKHPAIGSVNDVSGSWVVPTLSPSTGNTYCSIWVGIDGYSNNTVEQIGTEQDWTINGQENFAWFEMYPQGAYEIVNFPVNNNDHIAAGVSYRGNHIFLLVIINYTKNVHFIVPSFYTKSTQAQRSSAEWIVEAPSSSLTGNVLPLAHYGTALFSNCVATINGITGGINNSHWKYDPLTMITDNHLIKSLPSNLSKNGKSFTVAWEHE